MKFVNKKWGYELWIENNSEYCCKHLHIAPKKSCSVHYHKNKKETFYILNGELLLTYSTDSSVEEWEDKKEYWKLCEKESIVLKKGDSFTINRFIPHTFTTNLNISCDFIESSTYHEDSDSYRIIESR
tara:strand:+ start:305 stop:688 length:384 start_codon:yes stop_codon:yes gene_type:complete